MLGVSGKRVLLIIHILLISIWIGTLLVILLLLLLKNDLFDLTQFASVDKIIFLLFDSIIMNISIAVALSGLLFSMFTQWGFFRFHWVSTKWVTIILLALMLMFFVSPSINAMAALSDVHNEQVVNHAEYLEFEQQNLLYSFVQIAILIFVVSISVIKPWGQRKPKKIMNRKLILILGTIFGTLLIAGLVSQYLQLNQFRNLKINEIDLTGLADGYYSANVNYGYEYSARIYIENNKIKTIQFPQNRESVYARLAEGIKHKIIKQQKINLDTVTGATTTSKILMKAIEKALKANARNTLCFD
jgi:uncharacterized protein with FMN-binding domain